MYPNLTIENLMTGEELIEYGFDPAVLRAWIAVLVAWLDVNYPVGP